MGSEMCIRDRINDIPYRTGDGLLMCDSIRPITLLEARLSKGGGWAGSDISSVNSILPTKLDTRDRRHGGERFFARYTFPTGKLASVGFLGLYSTDGDTIPLTGGRRGVQYRMRAI